MLTNWQRPAIVLGGVAAVGLLGWAMSALSYDIWGALVVAPILAFGSWSLVNRAFGSRCPELIPVVWAGLAVKAVGTLAGYAIRFDAYDGSADAAVYHAAGRTLAAGVRTGIASPATVLPTGTDSDFIEQLTGLVYTIFGSSRLGGFFVFAWMSYVGTMLVLLAGVIALPGLARRRYAVLLAFTPSLVYWGSSTGKEAVMGLLLGAGTFGAAVLLATPRHRFPAVVLCATSLGLAARIRPHFAAVWAGALVVGLVGRVGTDAIRARRGRGQPVSRVRTAALAVLAVGGFVALAVATLGALDPIAEDAGPVSVGDRVATIFERTEVQTGQGGSNFETPSIDNPVMWPVAAARTLTRPMLFEARSIAEVLPAIEMTGLVGILLLGWRRLLALPRLLLRHPYLVFALVAVVTFGVAFSSIGNLGILVRQRSLILPLMLLFWSLPLPTPSGPAAARARTRTARPMIGVVPEGSAR